MGFNDFWNDRADAANDFLNTGVINSIVQNSNNFSSGSLSSPSTGSGNSGLSTGSNCVSTSQCPSGWGCVNGRCQQLTNGSSTSISSPGRGGNCDPDEPEAPCNSGGPNSCQEQPQCGDTDDQARARDCCGTRCCSFGSASSSRPGISCYCGECPPLPGCTRFCDSYLKANGEVGPGCGEGSGGNSCDGCSECDGNVGGECQPIFIGADCWCEQEGECNSDNCETCVTDEDSPDLGSCRLDESNCQQCATITNHLCPCNIILPPITVCKPYGEGGLLPINLAQREAAEQCGEECDIKPDPCKPKTTSATYCGGVACPEGSTQTGFLEAGGETCVFCSTKDYSDLPDSCKDCDCNCHDDCPNCQLCGADGTCYPDPACEGYWAEGVLVQRVDYGVCIQLCSLYPDYSLGQYIFNGLNYSLAASISGQIGVDDTGLYTQYTGVDGSPQYCGPAGVGAPGAQYYDAFNSDGTKVSSSQFFGSGEQGNCPSPGFFFYNEKRYSHTIIRGVGETLQEAIADMNSKIPASCSGVNCAGDPPDSLS